MPLKSLRDQIENVNNKVESQVPSVSDAAREAASNSKKIRLSMGQIKS